jgi:hypothetical protein
MAENFSTSIPKMLFSTTVLDDDDDDTNLDIHSTTTTARIEHTERNSPIVKDSDRFSAMILWSSSHVESNIPAIVV